MLAIIFFIIVMFCLFMINIWLGATIMALIIYTLITNQD